MMKISPLAPAIGGRIDDCDLTQSLNSSQVEQIQDAFLTHAVLLFPGQSLTHQDQLRAAQILGNLEPCTGQESSNPRPTIPSQMES